ncbi:MAG: hypothetical protein ETSY2_00075 [Candidatus Entotheonella gemina]|uniref:Uncharacterized protein n=1 Tax=Candidatus Entotheonella gemina TaxID=1429439 RepID=W4MHC8_9BACT|nr:MAG: hypothetical protein ETSY2_00075 [Candidatus Entotheonella gemina]
MFTRTHYSHAARGVEQRTRTYFRAGLQLRTAPQLLRELGGDNGLSQDRLDHEHVIDVQKKIREPSR